jgi:hypothetical protein
MQIACSPPGCKSLKTVDKARQGLLSPTLTGFGCQFLQPIRGHHEEALVSRGNRAEPAKKETAVIHDT